MTIHELLAPRNKIDQLREALQFARQRKKSEGASPRSLTAAFFAIIERNLMEQLSIHDFSFKETMGFDPEKRFSDLCRNEGEDPIEMYQDLYNIWCKNSMF